jgi:two-component sensor histidine kinase
MRPSPVTGTYIMLRESAILFLKVFFGSYLVIGLLYNNSISTFEGMYKVGVSAFGSAAIWVSSSYMNVIWKERYDWVHKPVERLLLNLALTAVTTFSIFVCIVSAWEAPWKGLDLGRVFRNFDLGEFLPTFFITLFISIFMHGRTFLLEWRHAAAEAERLKKEQIAAQYETLKNQVNPHFLFNSLNVLTALVHRDADQAEQFVRQLSKVYRYVLDSRNSETVTLEQELQQLEAYIFLLKIRFNESFHAEIKVDSRQKQIAPLTLQMLVENAIKHNESSKSNPLYVKIWEENDHVVVRNNLQHKSMVSDSSGVGLSNIRARYAFLTDKPIAIKETAEYFEVRIPTV